MPMPKNHFPRFPCLSCIIIVFGNRLYLVDWAIMIFLVDCTEEIKQQAFAFVSFKSHTEFHSNVFINIDANDCE